MKTNRIIRRLAYLLFPNWYRGQMQHALDISNAKRAERMDAWLKAQCYNHFFTLACRGSKFDMDDLECSI